MEIIKNISYHWILYSLSVLLYLSSIYFFYSSDITWGLSLFSLASCINIFLVFKDIPSVSETSFFSMLFFSLITCLSTSGIPSEESYEKAYMLVLFVSEACILVNSVYWNITKGGWRRIVSLILILISILIVILFGITAPDYYPNFIYTRLFVLIIFLLGMFITIRSKKFRKVFGIFVILFSLVMLFLSTVFFASTIYTITGEEESLILENTNTKAEEMLKSYNEENWNEFSKYFSDSLNEQFQDEIYTVSEWKDTYGEYTKVGDPEVKRVEGTYYVEYPVYFENDEEMEYYFVLELFSIDSDIYGFYISTEKY